MGNYERERGASESECVWSRQKADLKGSVAYSRGGNKILHSEVETHRFALKCTPLVLFEPELTQESQFSDN